MRYFTDAAEMPVTFLYFLWHTIVVKVHAQLQNLGENIIFYNAYGKID
jgi:hypothetical protein